MDYRSFNKIKALHILYPLTSTRKQKFQFTMHGFAQKVFGTQFFVALKIGVDAPGVLAALRL